MLTVMHNFNPVIRFKPLLIVVQSFQLFFYFYFFNFYFLEVLYLLPPGMMHLLKLCEYGVHSLLQLETWGILK